jgi:hypothetical protein
MSLEKVKVSEQLHEVVTESLQKIEGELGRLKTEQKKNGTAPDEDREERENNLKKKKLKYELKQMQKIERGDNKEWLYDRTEAKYCYCGTPSHGEMVECEEPYCEREWFHRNCIADKTLPDQWFCNDCKRLKDKFKSNTTKWYIA